MSYIDLRQINMYVYIKRLIINIKCVQIRSLNTFIVVEQERKDEGKKKWIHSNLRMDDDLGFTFLISCRCDRGIKISLDWYFFIILDYSLFLGQKIRVLYLIRMFKVSIM